MPDRPRSSDYAAFISYSHALDVELAPALQRGLHGLARPWYRMRALRVFRDQTNLAANPNLWSAIESALSGSAFFVLLASPSAAGSTWVRKEIDYWRRNRERASFLIVVTDGSVAWDSVAGDFDWSRTSALPPDLRGYFDAEPLWLDLSWARGTDQLSLRHSRFRDAVATLAAPMHGRAKDELDSEDVRQHRVFSRVRRITVTAIALLMVLAVVAGLIAWQQRNIAREQARIATSQALATQAEKLASTQPSLAVNLALYAYELSPTFEAKSAMATLVGANRHVRDHVGGGFEQVAASQPASSPVNNIVALSGDGRVLAHYSELDGQDGALRLYDVAGNRELGSLPRRGGLSPRSSGMALDRDGGRLALFDYSTIELWEVSGRARIHTVDTGPQLQSVSISPDGRWIAAARSDENNGPAQVTVWNADTSAKIAEWDTSTYYPAMRFSGDSKRMLVVSAAEGKRRTLDLASHEWSEPEPFPRLDNAFVFPDESGARAAVLVDSQLQVWDLRTQRQLASQEAKDTAANGIQFSADGQVVVVGTLTGQVDAYDTTLKHIAQLARYQHGVVTVSLSADSGLLASTAEDGSLTMSRPTEGDRLAPDPGRAVAVSMDGRVALRGRRGSTEFWDLAAHQKHGELPFALNSGANANVAAVDATADMARVAVLNGGILRIWDAAAATPAGQVTVDSHNAAGSRADSILVRFLPDNRHLVALSGSVSPAVVVDSQTFAVTQKFDARTFAVSADRRVLALLGPGGGEGAAVDIWRWRDSGRFEHVRTLSLPGDSQLARLALDSTGDRLVMADSDSRLILADVSGDRDPRALGGRLASPSTGVAFSGDEKILVQDGNWAGQSSVLLWDIDSGDQLAHWALASSETYSTGLAQLVGAPTSSAALTVGPDGITHWPVGVDQWHDTLCAMAHAPLTDQERRRYLANVDTETPCQRH